MAADKGRKMIELETQAPLDHEPAASPQPVTQADYKADTCPLCYRPLDQRIRGLYCPRCRGWLVEETRGGALVYNLWQGSV